MSRRGALLTLLGMILPTICLGLFLWEPIWIWATTERVYLTSLSNDGEGELVRGYRTVKRPERKGRFFSDSETRHGKTVMWFMETGFVAELEEHRDGSLLGPATTWNPDGTVAFQWRFTEGSGQGPFGSVHEIEFNRSPPWWTDVRDQGKPSMPAWMKDEDQWRRARDARNRSR